MHAIECVSDPGCFGAEDRASKREHDVADDSNRLVAPEVPARSAGQALVLPTSSERREAALVAESVEKDGKSFGVGEWALCDLDGYESALIQVSRMVQVTLA